jgi:hypothetical protein
VLVSSYQGSYGLANALGGFCLDRRQATEETDWTPVVGPPAMRVGVG